MNAPSIAQRLQQVRHNIVQAAAQAQRPAQDIALLAVSKTFDAQAVREAADAGQRDFGENYVQEAVDKITTLRAQGVRGLRWHCIGPVQSRKTALVAAHFDWLHSLSRLDIAQRLSRQRPPDLPPLQVCIQVNMDASASKAGLAPDEALALAQAVCTLPQLQLRGIMNMPDPDADPQRTLHIHRATHALFVRLGSALALPAAQWNTLSMGMSADMSAAIAAGSTLVRVGSAIFGRR